MKEMDPFSSENGRICAEKYIFYSLGVYDVWVTDTVDSAAFLIKGPCF